MSYIEIHTSLSLTWEQKHDLARRIITSFRICTGVAPHEVDVGFIPVDIFNGRQFFMTATELPNTIKGGTSIYSINEPAPPFLRIRVTTPPWTESHKNAQFLNENIFQRFQADADAWSTALPMDVASVGDQGDPNAYASRRNILNRMSFAGGNGASSCVKGSDDGEEGFLDEDHEEEQYGVDLGPVVVEIRWMDYNLWSLGGQAVHRPDI